VRKTVRALAFGAIATSLVLTAACSANEGTQVEQETQEAAQFFVDYEGKTVTPRPDVEGAKSGGTITVLQTDDFEHLDPGQIYVSNALSYGQLFHRTLTGYIETGKEGDPLSLVGDLATNAGVTTDGGKTWTYTLRDGLKYDDGSPIVAKDIAYGISRAFSQFGAQGTQFLQAALDKNYGKEGAYTGPYDGTPLAPGLTVEGDKVIKFAFDRPHLELPYLLAFTISTPVPQAKDTKEKYETEFVSSGPYKRAEYIQGTRLVLEKNPNWDPKTDPIRKQYVDKFVFDFTPDAKTQTDRVTAANGDDAAAVMVSNVPPDQIPVVKANAELMTRVGQAPNQYVYYLNINTTRVTDVDIRRALNYGLDRDAYIKAVGGFDVANPATTITSPVNPAYLKFDVYPSLPDNHGDVEKAKKLLEGKTVPSLSFCTANTATNQKVAAVIVESYKRIGVTLVPKFIASADYYTTVGTKGIDCDVITSAWGQDFPDGASVLGVLMDGAIRPEGNNNYSYFTDSATDAKLKEIAAMQDRGAAAKAYGELEKEIMEKHAPLVPLRYGRTFSLFGPKVGGTFLNQFSQFDANAIYVK
jgi:peptide/nickel transport system substrate-binding protein